MTPKNNKARLLYYIKLCVSFQIHQWIQTGVTVRKRPNWVKFDNFFLPMTLQFDVWPWKTIGHLFYATSSYAHHFVAIGEFKLELWSGHAQFESNSTIFFSRVTFKFDGWHWKTIGHIFYAISSFVCHFVAIGGFKLELQSVNTQFGSKSIFLAVRVTLQFDVWPWKITRHTFYATSSFLNHFVAIGEFKLELQSRNPQFGSNSTIFRAVWPWNLTYELKK